MEREIVVRVLDNGWTVTQESGPRDLGTPRALVALSIKDLASALTRLVLPRATHRLEPVCCCGQTSMDEIVVPKESFRALVRFTKQIVAGDDDVLLEMTDEDFKAAKALAGE